MVRTSTQSEQSLVSFLIKLISLFSLVLLQVSISHNVMAMDDRQKVDSGETQVVAKIGKREITVSELRVEMARLGLGDGTRQTEQFALQSIVNRHFLVNAARKADFHRKADATLRMKAAQEQALADFYLGTASQPPEPTLAEVEDYIAANPGLFARRTEYTFSVLALATSEFDVESMTPLFSETDDFKVLEDRLTRENIPFTVKPLVQVSSSFPTEIRQQLGRYTISDNIVLKSNDEAQIMKIVKARPNPVATDQWHAISRRIVMEENAVRRAKSLVDSLKLGNSVVYFREDLAPVKVKSPDSNKTTGK